MNEAINLNVDNNMNQINNANGFNNPILNQYNQINPMLNFDQCIPMINHLNLMLNQMNIMLNQINLYNQNYPKLNFDKISFMNEMMKQMNQIENQMKEMMNQINQKMNEINQEISQTNEKIKETIQNINLNNLNKNQMELINSIIKFYKENGNEYMSFDNPNQIKNMVYFLSLNYYKLDISNNVEDPLYYVKEPKKMIKFINTNYIQYNVFIPLSITKYDLYSIAQIYKCFKNTDKNDTGNHSNILLIYNNLILNKDETSIECINENDIIIIIEPRNFPDDSYYKSLQERTEKKRQMSFEFVSGKRINRIFPEDIKIYEIYKSINLEFGFDINSYYIYTKGEILKIKDQRKGSFLFDLIITIYEWNPFIRHSFGKIVMVKIKLNKEIEISESIGILNSIKYLKELILVSLGGKKIKQLKIENKVIEEGVNRSLFSLGIKNDFTCSVEYEE